MAPGSQVADGSGGTYVVWSDTRNGNADIYVQHLSATGVMLWSTGGVAACTAAGNQLAPVTIGDGSGGVIVCWEDGRAANTAAYAQRLSSGGTALWSANGVAVGTSAGPQASPAMASDGAGGAFVAWEDASGATSVIFGQRLTAAGVLQWGATGVQLATQSGDAYEPLVIQDLQGGAIMAWVYLTSSFTYDIYAQRVDGNGTAQWTAAAKAVVLASGDQWFPDIAAAGDGGFYAVWEDDRSTSFTQGRARRFNAIGSPVWASDALLTTDTNGQSRPHVIALGTSGMIAAWDDGRFAVLAQKLLGANGARAWGEGVFVSALGEGNTVLADAAGGAVVCWTEPRGETANVYGQRLNGSGVAQWAASGVTLSAAADDQLGPAICDDGQGGAIVVWEDRRSTDSELYAQRLTLAGASQWATDGVPVRAASGVEKNAAVASDGAGGAFLVWQDRRRGNYDIYAQHWNASGQFTWSPAVRVCGAAGVQQMPRVVADGLGGAIVAWCDGRVTSGYFGDLYAQRLNATGVPQWTANGVAVCSAVFDQAPPDMTADGVGGAILAWDDYRLPGNADIYAQRLSAAGSPLWGANGFAVCTAANDQTGARLIGSGPGAAVVAWSDERGADTDIYAQRVNAAGAALWSANGVKVCGAVNEQSAVAVTSDGARGAILAWQDERVAFLAQDLFAQRIDSTGAARWTANGVSLNSSSGNQTRPLLATDGAGGAFATWSDSRGTSDLYVQRIRAAGTLVFTSAGIVLCNAAGIQSPAGVVSDGATGAIVAWADARSGISVMFGQKLDAAGVVKWTANGTPLTNGAGPMLAPAAVADGAGGLIAAWHDGRNPAATYIYGQRLNTTGSALWVPGGNPSVDVSDKAAGAALRLARLEPNPARERLRVEFVVPASTRTTLDLVDVTGRVVQSRTLEGLSPGRHVLELHPLANTPPGVYFVRLKQGRETSVARISVLH